MGSIKKISVLFIVTIVIVVIIALLYFSGIFIPTSLKTGSFETIVVDRGMVISTTHATGIVESENEVIVLSPAASIIKNILKEPGSRVKEGETIVQLNSETVQNEIEKLKDQLEVKRNNLDKTRLNAQSSTLDLEYNEEVKKLKITSLKSQLTDEQQLLEVGGISPAKLDKTAQEITLAEKDLSMMIEKNSIRLKQLATDEKGLLLQIRMDEKVLEEKQELLSKMNVKAPSAGIILNISGSVGEKTSTDKMLIRMSDLTSFKLTGSIEEQFANQIKTGKQVYVTVEYEQLEGLIGNITPMVENKKIQFNVHLKESSHPKLIANQNVQILIINNQKENSLRINKLPSFEKGKKHNVFVIEGDKAVKREITFGIIGNDYCEILSGLNDGDVIISEGINAYRHLNEIEIQN
ncbi:MAG: HlyD family efflux transporter periplasmic adaptor subunit [Prolixibacteraceae bacterium]|jgi:HlyD family secretion protein|nr:HlyD family efflux transporter periplasmic adaptor subunit [Prolixibacteraceae bacterium]MBT6006446.1 HlyD family efflux transporter periplasmic adaptor subunit [Prolixibacteraceae bacterium]MBT6763192.1 HlyD family efflux transporter periplasmic adaptor subunit [Prolixibacteraceae bacterium]MBT7000808.1 HlyD family efflux transporter periplasmic adaptor subunit [Prolixibacteraceae bacterium]MBT7397011.1 HlyD family efflux transporter periplasmic adaptor subunit [Prolixibacteraceae bacterium